MTGLPSSYVLGPERDKLDRYYTPDDVADRLIGLLVREQYLRTSDHVLEPSCGGGAFVRALHAHSIRSVSAIDVDPEAPGFRDTTCADVRDFLEGEREDLLDALDLDWVDWVIGNPPYAHAEAHARRALEVAPNVAFLLRLGFLESIKRRPFWSELPPAAVYVLSSRPSFTGGGTDRGQAYGLFVWLGKGRGPVRPPILGWV